MFTRGECQLQTLGEYQEISMTRLVAQTIFVLYDHFS